MRAVIMAGGEGTRLRPLTASAPKPLLPVVGRPLLEHLLLLLKDHGMTESVVTLQYLASMVRTYFGDGSDLGVDLTYATAKRKVGTAGSVKHAASALRGDTFLVISGDGLTDIDLTGLQEFHRAKGGAVTICLARRPNPLDFGIVVTDDEGRIERFLEKPSWGQVFTDTVNTGIYVVEPEVLDEIPEGVEVDWAKDVFPRLLEGGAPMFGFIADGYWQDVGTLEAYQRAQTDALDGRVRLDIPGFETTPGVYLGQGVEIGEGATLSGPLFIGDYSRVEGGARIEPYSVVGRHAVVRAGALVERATLLDNVFVGEDVELRGCVVGRHTDILRGARVEEGSFVGDDCRLEPEVVITAGADVYPYKTIEAGEVVVESVVWESRSSQRLFAGERVRGVVNIDVTPELAVRLSGAFATMLPQGGKVAIARDHAAVSHALSLTIMGALMATGAEVRVLGTCPIPVARSFVRAHADGGVVIRTTPGALEHVDILLLDSQGTELDLRERQQLERIVNRHDIRRPFPGEVGSVSAPIAPIEDYCAKVLAGTDLTGVDEADLRIVVDTSGGTCATVLPALLSAVEVEALSVNARLTPNHPTESEEQRTEALRRLGLMVASSRAALGLRIDPTGERLSIVDETGRVLSDDRALLVVLDLLAAERRGGFVALPVTTTRVAEQVAAYHGVNVIWTTTGPQALAQATTTADLILAGDANGGFVFPAVGSSCDAMAALMALLGLVARTRLTLRGIDTRIPSTALLREAVRTPWARKGAVMRQVRLAALNRRTDETEGLRILYEDDAWVLVAPDPGEAIVRLWVEAPTEGRARTLLAEWREIVEAASQPPPEDDGS